MKKILLALSLALLMVSSSFAGDADDVNAATAAFRKALIDGDKAALEKIVLPDLIYVHSAGKVENAKQFVDAIVGDNKLDTYHEVNFVNQKVSVGGDLAFVQHIFDGKLSSKGRNDNPYAVHLGVIQLWKKDNGVWRLQARKSTFMPF